MHLYSKISSIFVKKSLHAGAIIWFLQLLYHQQLSLNFFGLTHLLRLVKKVYILLTFQAKKSEFCWTINN